MDNETISSEKARLYTSNLEELTAEPAVTDYGAIILCTGGTATMCIDFKNWRLHKDAVITLFPNDAVLLKDVSPDFTVEILRYDKVLLREASLQLEQTVYSSLRKDRCRTDSKVVTDIIKGMFNLLRIYFSQKECVCLDQMVLYQLKAFFLGFYDWIYRNGSAQTDEEGSRRTNELFNRFMENMERFYQREHDVAFYAELLSITPKYLNTIVRRKTGQTTKSIIDQYLTMQLKLRLRTSGMSVKQIAWDFRFSDVSFFCRFFKQHTGQTPQQFRKSVRQ